MSMRKPTRTIWPFPPKGESEEEGDPVLAGVEFALRRQAWRKVSLGIRGSVDRTYTLWVRVLRGRAFRLHGLPEGHDIDTVEGRRSFAAEAMKAASPPDRQAVLLDRQVALDLAARALAEVIGAPRPHHALPMVRIKGQAAWSHIIWGLVHREEPPLAGFVEDIDWHATWPAQTAQRQQLEGAYARLVEKVVDWLGEGA